MGLSEHEMEFEEHEVGFEEHEVGFDQPFPYGCQIFC